jgi:hydrogenase maturation protease
VKCLVLGLGNLLLGDEGVGIHALWALANENCPEDTELLIVETAILDALPALEKAEYVIIVDAMKAHRPPGAIYRIRLEDCDFDGPIASLHGLNLGRVLALSDRKSPPEVVVMGVEPAVIDWSLDLSPAVADVLPDLLAVIKKEIASATQVTQAPEKRAALCVKG